MTMTVNSRALRYSPFQPDSSHHELSTRHLPLTKLGLWNQWSNIAVFKTGNSLLILLAEIASHGHSRRHILHFCVSKVEMFSSKADVRGRRRITTENCFRLIFNKTTAVETSKTLFVETPWPTDTTRGSDGKCFTRNSDKVDIVVVFQTRDESGRCFANSSSCHRNGRHAEQWT